MTAMDVYYILSEEFSLDSFVVLTYKVDDFFNLKLGQLCNSSRRLMIRNVITGKSLRCERNNMLQEMQLWEDHFLPYHHRHMSKQKDVFC